MENEFVPYEQALVLKELGFDEPCFGYYLCRNSAFGIDDLKVTTKWIDLLPYDSSSCKTPLYQQAFRWFRENYDLTYSIILKMPRDGNGFKSEIQSGREIFNIGLQSKYEDSELMCLKKLIEIVKNK